MRRSALGDVAKVIAFVVGSFVLAALIAPLLYELGKGFANVFLNKDTADELKWLAEKAQKAEFARYFKRALMISAVILLFPLIYSLRLRMDPQKLRNTPWSIYLPKETIAPAAGQPLQKVRWGVLQLLTGFFLASGLFLAMAWFLFQLNWFHWNLTPTQDSVLTAIKRAITPAVAASLVEEILFRGALLGIFLRAFRPWFAITSLSALFAAVHFLQPPAGAQVSDPTTFNAGFEMLQLIGMQFLQPQTLLYGFISLFVVGLILGYARYGTAALWLPIGLHAGWVFALKIFSKLTVRRPDLPEKFDIYMGHDLREGIIPLLTLAITAVVVAIYVRGLQKEPSEKQLIDLNEDVGPQKNEA